jgi:putative phosphoesterase
LKIGILSDIHGNYMALEAVVKDAKRHGCESYIILGDIVVKGLMPNETMELLSKLNILSWIKGNTDDWLFDDISLLDKINSKYLDYCIWNIKDEYLNVLKNKEDEIELTLEGKRILCVHGSPMSNIEILNSNLKHERLELLVSIKPSDIIFCGHSHIKGEFKFGNTKIINPGSVGLPFDGDNKASYCIYDTSDVVYFRKVSYDVQKYISMVEESSLPCKKSYISTIISGNLEVCDEE